jgi:two-component system OmpR family response regulator
LRADVTLPEMPKNPHVLVVDDHREIRELLAQLLKKEGYEVTTAGDGREMRAALLERSIDLVLLDVMLPQVDGLTLCRELRAQRVGLPIIMLTAKDDEIDRVLGLELGADDYVTKPFGSRELVARIRAVLRRVRAAPAPQPPEESRVYRFGRWIFDPSRRELVLDGDVVVPLSSGEFDLLLVFVTHPGRTLTRDRLLDLAKGRDAAPFDRSIDLQVSRLRKKLGDDARSPRIIKTVWGGGYTFAPRVTIE